MNIFKKFITNKSKSSRADEVTLSNLKKYVVEAYEEVDELKERLNIASNNEQELNKKIEVLEKEVDILELRKDSIFSDKINSERKVNKLETENRELNSKIDKLNNTLNDYVIADKQHQKTQQDVVKFELNKFVNSLKNEIKSQKGSISKNNFIEMLIKELTKNDDNLISLKKIKTIKDEI